MQINKIVDLANDSLTNAVHYAFFREALKEAIDVFPSYFLLSKNANLSAVKLTEISPNWESDFSIDPIAPAPECNLPIIVCAIWSFWDRDKTLEAYIRARVENLPNGRRNSGVLEHYILSAHLSIGFVLQFCSGFYRDIFARLAAFCQTSIEKGDVSCVRSFADAKGDAIAWQFEPSEGYGFLMRGLKLEDK